MGTTAENRNYWSAYPWSEQGDEWSSTWGGTQYLWYGTIFPRIHAFVPTQSILEIAPGYGRCTQYLLGLCQRLAVVDLAEKCIESCRTRFSPHSHISYFVNDGKSLDMIEDGSVDFVFSWDSLVHAESDVLYCYVRQLAAKLKPGGWGFIHHSNIGSFKDARTGKLSVENRHWRAESMTADLFERFCDAVGLTCVGQEIVAWGCSDLTDCFSVFTRDSTRTNSKPARIENANFMEEAARMKRLANLYSPASRPPDHVVQRREGALSVQSAGETETTIRQLEDLLSLDPHNAEIQNDVGVLYYQRGEIENAVTHFQQSVAIDSTNITAQKNLAQAYLELGRTGEALKLYQTILSRYPDDVETLLVIGRLCLEAGRIEKASDFFRKVLDVDPTNSTARQHLETLVHHT